MSPKKGRKLRKKNCKDKISEWSPVLQDTHVTSLTDINPEILPPSDSSLGKSILNYEMVQSNISLSETRDIDLLTGPYPPDSTLSDIIGQQSQETLFKKPFSHRSKVNTRLSLFDSDPQDSEPDESPQKVLHRPFKTKKKEPVNSKIFNIDSSQENISFSDKSLNASKTQSNFITRRKNKREKTIPVDIFESALETSESESSFVGKRAVFLRHKSSKKNLSAFEDSVNVCINTSPLNVTDCKDQYESEPGSAPEQSRGSAKTCDDSSPPPGLIISKKVRNRAKSLNKTDEFFNEISNDSICDELSSHDVRVPFKGRKLRENAVDMHIFDSDISSGTLNNSEISFTHSKKLPSKEKDPVEKTITQTGHFPSSEPLESSNNLSKITIAPSPHDKSLTKPFKTHSKKVKKSEEVENFDESFNISLNDSTSDKSACPNVRVPFKGYKQRRKAVDSNIFDSDINSSGALNNSEISFIHSKKLPLKEKNPVEKTITQTGQFPSSEPFQSSNSLNKITTTTSPHDTSLTITTKPFKTHPKKVKNREEVENFDESFNISLNDSTSDKSACPNVRVPFKGYKQRRKAVDSNIFDSDINSSNALNNSETSFTHSKKLTFKEKNPVENTITQTGQFPSSEPFESSNNLNKITITTSPHDTSLTKPFKNHSKKLEKSDESFNRSPNDSTSDKSVGPNVRVPFKDKRKIRKSVDAALFDSDLDFSSNTSSHFVGLNNTKVNENNCSAKVSAADLNCVPQANTPKCNEEFNINVAEKNSVLGEDDVKNPSNVPQNDESICCNGAVPFNDTSKNKTFNSNMSGSVLNHSDKIHQSISCLDDSKNNSICETTSAEAGEFAKSNDNQANVSKVNEIVNQKLTENSEVRSLEMNMSVKEKIRFDSSNFKTNFCNWSIPESRLSTSKKRVSFKVTSEEIHYDTNSIPSDSTRCRINESQNEKSFLSFGSLRCETSSTDTPLESVCLFLEASKSNLQSASNSENNEETPSVPEGSGFFRNTLQKTDTLNDCDESTKNSSEEENTLEKSKNTIDEESARSIEEEERAVSVGEEESAGSSLEEESLESVSEEESEEEFYKSSKTNHSKEESCTSATNRNQNDRSTFSQKTPDCTYDENLEFGAQPLKETSSRAGRVSNQGSLSRKSTREVLLPNSKNHFKKPGPQTIFNEPVPPPLNKRKVQEILDTIPLSELKKKRKTGTVSLATKEQMEQNKIEEMVRRRQKKGNVFQRSPPIKLKKPHKYISRKLYDIFIDKLKPRYGIKSRVEAEKLMVFLNENVEKILKKKVNLVDSVNDMKMQLAMANIIKTHWDFYNFIMRYFDGMISDIIYPPDFNFVSPYNPKGSCDENIL